MSEKAEPGPRPGRPPRWLFLAMFLLALVPRLAVVGSGFVSLAPDTETYAMPARNLVAGRGYADDQGRPYSFRPPTYPLFLAAVFALAGESIRAVQILQALLAAAGIGGLALWLARRQGLPAGAAAGALLALDPILIPVPAFVLTEALGTLLVPGIVICLDRGSITGRRRHFLAAGLLGGAAALNTPVTLLLVPWLLLTAALVSPRRRVGWPRWALAVGVTAGCLAVWTARNYLARGDAVVIRDNGFGSLVWATTEYDFDWLPYPTVPAYAALQRKLDALVAGLTDSEGHWLLLRLAWRNFLEDPVLVAKRILKANFWFWIEAPGAYVTGELVLVRWTALLFHQLQLLAFLVALAALWRAGRLAPWTPWVATACYFALFLSLLMPIPRYYVPLLPVMDTLIAIGLVSLRPARDPRARPSPAAPRPTRGA